MGHISSEKCAAVLPKSNSYCVAEVLACFVFLFKHLHMKLCCLIDSGLNFEILVKEFSIFF